MVDVMDLQGGGMAHAQARGWGDPSSRSYRADHIVGAQAAGAMLYLRREVVHLFMGFLQEITDRGYQLNNVRDDWGYAYRPIRGYEDEWEASHDFRWLSNHSWGLALDLDATDHPLGTHRDFPDWVVDVAKKWGLSWGGDYANRPDPMHFEFLGTPHDVAKYPLYEEDDMFTDDDRDVILATKAESAVTKAEVIALRKEVAILRGAIKGSNSQGGKSALWLKLESGFGAVIDAVKK